MIKRKCKWENKVNIREKAVLKAAFSGKVDLAKTCNCFKKAGDFKE